MTSRTKEDNREYMRDYMRDRRKARKRNREADRVRKRAKHKSEAPDIWSKADFVNRDAALYDPMRDGSLSYANPFALVMGDPPIGRRAIDQHQAQAGIRSVSLAGLRP
ncbi:hypothetical protein [Bradyrhizobium sp. I71]|uniref:hypothetical protein n=1 Tax=Bradyrhizobium sp. I71 TaxID=2590772 RepID=UPI001EF87B3E|nr:hypothetical protein [Bradyrhizobium sp. I71]ULK98873.1 hypothetical protein FJV43_03770 [Bradyrhizobium sp. I71]